MNLGGFQAASNVARPQIEERRHDPAASIHSRGACHERRAHGRTDDRQHDRREVDVTTRDHELHHLDGQAQTRGQTATTETIARTPRRPDSRAARPSKPPTSIQASSSAHHKPAFAAGVGPPGDGPKGISRAVLSVASDTGAAQFVVRRQETGEQQTRRDRNGTRRQRAGQQQLPNSDRRDRPDPARQRPADRVRRRPSRMCWSPGRRPTWSVWGRISGQTPPIRSSTPRSPWPGPASATRLDPRSARQIGQQKSPRHEKERHCYTHRPTTRPDPVKDAPTSVATSKLNQFA